MIFSFINIISFFWFARTIKFVLFWIYLWQLKEYHIGRFIDHFRTHKGKKIFLNYFWLSKFLLLALLFLNFNLAFNLLLLVYIAESLLFGLNMVKKTVKLPKFTSKTILLTAIVLLDVIGFLFFSYAYIQTATWFTLALLAYDIFVPVIVSLIVLIIQPFFVTARNNILKKAKDKMAGFPNLKVIGITGSYGKTSTKEFLTTILNSRLRGQAKFNVLSTPEHKNSEMGIAQTILKDLNEKHEIFIVEMGSYNKGGIQLLCNMVEPQIGVVTGVNEQHLATFGSLENLLSAEGGRELLDCLPEHGLLVVNGDNKYCVDLYKKANIRKQIYTLQKQNINSDIWTEDVIVNKESISFIALSKDKTLIEGPFGAKKEMANFNVNVLGKQNVQNLLAAILVAKDFGMDSGEIAEACKNIKPEQAGMTLRKGVHGINIIDSSYSSNPDGVMADLDYLNVFSGKKIIVMPCLIELGNKSIETHIQIGKKIAQVCDLGIITTKDKFKEIKMGAVANGMTESQILLCDNPSEIQNIITAEYKEGDAVLLEGRVPGKLIKLLAEK